MLHCDSSWNAIFNAPKMSPMSDFYGNRGNLKIANDVRRINNSGFNAVKDEEHY
ncbi:hypothetical protein T4E_4316 [Trichinella pseudospiralis]|uniref:Uncharacterized protein n=1 Tax=Trichinella pseudospiralis TaxID=6337 RepID=A0A0V0YG27_TRIPS|nr:hypothetical protein T4E_4316 [Trichinella pseudospiralis]